MPCERCGRDLQTRVWQVSTTNLVAKCTGSPRTVVRSVVLCPSPTKPTFHCWARLWPLARDPQSTAFYRFLLQREN